MAAEKQALGSEFTDAQLNYAPLAGAAIGGLGGAIFSKKKNMLRNALIGAASGGLAGGLGAAGYRYGVKPWDLEERANRTLLQTKALQDYATNWNGFRSSRDSDIERTMQDALANNIFHARGLGIGALGVAGGLGAGGLMAAAAPDDSKDDTPSHPKTAEHAMSDMPVRKPMHVHEAGEKTQDISPTQTETEHKEEVLTGSLGQKAAQALQILAKQAAEKKAGPISETLSGMNPLNMYGGGLLGGAAALAMPTRSLARQAEYDSSDNALRALGNVLVPGMGAYNGFKRLGAGIRSPEMKKIRALREADKLKRELTAIAPREEAPAAESAEKTDTAAKAAGWKSEFAGMLNPLNMVAGYPAMALAGLTPTRTLDEQAAADEEVLPNLFVPGRNVYNIYKRMGATTRSPEMLRLREDAKRRKMDALLAKHAPQAPSAPVEEKAAARGDASRRVENSERFQRDLGSDSRWGQPKSRSTYEHGALARTNAGSSADEKDGIRTYATVIRRYDKLNKGQGEKSANTAFAFGVKMAFDIKSTDLVVPALGAGVGALGGMALGKKKEKIRSALMGAALGAGAGGVAEHMLPGLGLGMKYIGQDVTEGAKNLVTGHSPTTMDKLRRAARLGEIGGEMFRRKSTLPGLEMLGKTVETAQNAMPHWRG